MDMDEEELLYDFIVVVFYFIAKSSELNELIALNSHILFIKTKFLFALGMEYEGLGILIYFSEFMND